MERLVPRPRTCRVLEGRFEIGETTRLQVFCGDCEMVAFAGERFAELVEEEFGHRIDTACMARQGAFQLVLWNVPHEIVATPVASEQAEGYVIEVTRDAAVVTAATPQGLFYGAMTLRQLVDKDAEGLWLPLVNIEDWPRYRWRGFAIDSGRAVNNMAKIKRVIRVCSTFKLNFLLFREGDDELAAVKYRTNRLGSGNPYAFTMDQIKELIEYAERYGVMVIPEVESLGHSTAKGFDYPELVSGGFEHKYGELVTHIRKSHLTPADPKSFELLESIYDEWFSLAEPESLSQDGGGRSYMIHLGLDEVRLDAEIQAKHLEGLLPVVDRVGKKHLLEVTPIVWADAPSTPPEFADRVIRCLWHYGDTQWGVDYENAHLIRQGLRELTEGTRHDWVFMAAGSGSGHTPYSKSDYPGSFDNLAQWAIWGKELPNFIGLLAVQWSGNTLDQWLPDFAAAADVAWNPPDSKPEFEGWFDRIKRQLARLNDAANPSPDEVDPECWDGIWLKDGDWYHDIMSGKKAGE